jgi:hypothetical protein
MKSYYYLLVLLCISFFITPKEEKVSRIARGTLYAEFTKTLAHDMGYYYLLNSLSTRTAEYIRALDFNMRSYIQDLRFKNLQLRANAEAYNLGDMLTRLEESINAFFASADYAFIIIGNELDANDNTKEEKQAFIKREMDRLQKSVDTLINQSQTRFTQALT